MLISRDWLQDFIEQLIDREDPRVLAEALTLHTVEIDDWTDFEEDCKGIVVGKILSIDKHPDADKLSVAMVDIGVEKPLQVVFGQVAKAVVGMLIPVAVAPTKIHGGKNIERTVLRGVESQGMFCLEQELGIRKTGATLPKIASKYKPGTQISEAIDLYDVVYELDNKSITHRPDLWSVYGLAREVATIKRLKLKPYHYKPFRAGKNSDLKVSVLENGLCKRYMALVIDGVNGTQQSPEWLQRRLEIVGVRIINAIVDITNYVMIECGQPLHAFDYDKIGVDQGGSHSPEIKVRLAESGEKITTLDGLERKLDETMLVIASATTPIAVAGVMGGESCAVGPGTNKIIIESATFNAPSIRSTSVKLGLRTDAVMRFEKSIDPLLADVALKRTVELIKQVFPEAKIISKIYDLGHYKTDPIDIKIDKNFINARLGAILTTKEIKGILTGLGFGITAKGDNLRVRVPSWRATGDVCVKEDLVEEVARMYGFDKIIPNLPHVHMAVQPVYDEFYTERILRNIFSMALGMTEVSSYSFVSGKDIEKLGENADRYIKIANPLSSETEFIRRTMTIGLLNTILKNQSEFDAVNIFEIGKGALTEAGGIRVREKSDNLLPGQPIFLGAAIMEKGNNAPWHKVRAGVDAISRYAGVHIEIGAKGHLPVWAHSGRQAVLCVGQNRIGYICELNPAILRAWEIKERVAILKINITEFAKHCNKYKSNYKTIPKFPFTKRDISIEVAAGIKQDSVRDIIAGFDSLIQSVELFDVYHKDAENKNLAYHIFFGSNEKTLSTGDVDAVFGALVVELGKKFNAKLHA